MTDLHTIRTASNKEIPEGTKVDFSMARLPAHIHVKLQLPGQIEFSDLGDLPIVDGTVTLTTKLVFLCHAKEDRVVVKNTSDRLWQDGVLTWFDEKDLVPGDDWEAVAEDAINRSDFVLIFLSEASIVKTGYIQHEMKYAFKQRELRPFGQRYIIPVLVEPCDPPRPFDKIHWLKLWEENAYGKLRKAIT